MLVADVPTRRGDRRSGSRAAGRSAAAARTRRRRRLEYVNRADGMHSGLRHLYASKLLSRGVSVKELADYLGHEDPGFTLRVYTHLLSSSHERARQAVDESAHIWELPPTNGLEAA
ncbi:tyrosine-type recombinase/integrase [Nocardia sp. NPDC058379]|uniref:tyrosine-type recombinase/integrase n=1 Tax=unclassified Nocardia TaxID=2637762 RepID=UPI0036530555